jgi:hypothetical protein
VSHGHVAVKGYAEWKKVFKSKGFCVEQVLRSSLIFGGPRYNKHPNFFAMVILADQLCDRLFFMKKFTEAHTYLLRKK